MKIFELFDKGLPYKWEEQDDKSWRATFDVNGVEYSVFMKKEKARKQVQINLDLKNMMK